MGEMPVARMIGLAVGDLSVHTWDLAKATGQDTALDGAVVDFLHPIMEGMSKRGPSPAFAPPVSVPDDAPRQDRLIGPNRPRAVAPTHSPLVGAILESPSAPASPPLESLAKPTGVWRGERRWHSLKPLPLWGD